MDQEDSDGEGYFTEWESSSEDEEEVQAHSGQEEDADDKKVALCSLSV